MDDHLLIPVAVGMKNEALKSNILYTNIFLYDNRLTIYLLLNPPRSLNTWIQIIPGSI